MTLDMEDMENQKQLSQKQVVIKMLLIGLRCFPVSGLC